MNPTKPADLRGLSDGEILGQIKESERSLVDMNFKNAVGQLENKAAIKVIRRDIARLKTILRERELGK